MFGQSELLCLDRFSFFFPPLVITPSSFPTYVGAAAASYTALADHSLTYKHHSVQKADVTRDVEQADSAAI